MFINHGKPHLLSGVIFCKNCGSKYTFVKGYKNSSYAICRNKKMYGKMVCDSKNIKEDILNEKVLNSLNDIFSKYANKDYIVNNLDYENENNIKEALLQEKANLEEKLSENNNIKFNLYLITGCKKARLAPSLNWLLVLGSNQRHHG